MSTRWISAFGLVVFIALAWVFSHERRRFPWRVVVWGVGLQFLFAVLILRTDAGRSVFAYAQTVVMRLIGFADEGARMVFGPLADRAFLREQWGADRDYIFLIPVAATIILVSALSSLLYHWGVLQRVVRAAAWVMQRAMRTSGSESLAAAANVFMGQTEAPMVIRPYLAGMTRSELMALMTGGMATIAGGVFAAYVGFGISAGHLLTASVLSAPASLMIAKVLWPETETSPTASGSPATVPRETANSIDALCRGAADGTTLAINVMAMLIAFVAVVALANALFTMVQEAAGVSDPVTLQVVLGWMNAPFAWLMGVPAKDCVAIGNVLGERLVLNEFVGYLSLTALREQALIEPRSQVLATYALCGFANFGSVAIQIGGIGALVPQRRSDLAAMGLRAMLGGVIACYLTATVAGLLL
ncbi:MAG TPA: nucleoside transporter C-terminal domain-containing protein [Verrucomicrobiota bacterium]|nr:nucleoside transporter C-terminal domain-containing protein [Verrucomicrobiota bacterium]HNU51282.1 nucleoside transporter C-terminal domain-containing protein [Verrucomicrobiota bacterium]